MAVSETDFPIKLEALSQRLGKRAPIADQIAESIRDMIVAGDLNPGDRIVESRIARQIGVGQPTVREALVALEHQGLVVRKANQGCVVVTLTEKEIGQILRIREELEALAIDLAIENASDDDLRKLHEHTRVMVDAARKREVQRFFTLDLEFHQTLWSLSGNSFLPRLLSQTLVPLLAFLFIRNLRMHQQIDFTASALAHVDIVETMMRRDRRAAESVAREKFQMFADEHLDWFDK
jgi:DNA-binding GntR family transcriptional regulator